MKKTEEYSSIPGQYSKFLSNISQTKTAYRRIFLLLKFSQKLNEVTLKKFSRLVVLKLTEEKPVRYKARGENIQTRNQRYVWEVFCIREKKNFTTNQSLSDAEKTALAV